jgi:hypothetical protein
MPCVVPIYSAVEVLRCNAPTGDFNRKEAALSLTGYQSFFAWLQLTAI